MEKITEEQKEKAFQMAGRMAENATPEEIDKATAKAGKFSGIKALSAVKEKLELLVALLKNPHVRGAAFAFAAGAILYLVSPFDVIPDILPFLGFADDVAVIASVFPLVVNTIKKDPKKMLEVIDSLPEKLKKCAFTVFGVAAGAVGGGYAGMKGAEALKDVKLAEEYSALGFDGMNAREVISSLKGMALEKVRQAVDSKLQKGIHDYFRTKCLRSLIVVTLVLLSIIFSLSPVKGAPYFASSFLAAALIYTFYSLIRGFIVSLPWIKSILKKKSLYRGVEAEILERYEIAAKAEKLLSSFNLMPSEAEIKKIAVFFLREFRRRLLLFILGFAAISLGFWLLRASLFQLHLARSMWDVLLWPFLCLTENMA
jgi:Uncharacterized conserved protein